MPLITKIEELKTYNAPANLGVEESTMLPAFRHIESTFILPELGQEQYDALLAAYEASLPPTNTAMSNALADLLDAVRKALAPLGILHYKNSVIQQISDAGSVERAGDNAIPVRMWVNNLQSETLFTEGMRELDALLKFLETNKSYFPLWTAGTGYSQFKEFILQTTDEFDNEVKINGSRKFFKALRPDVKYAEEMFLLQHIGEDFYNRLKEARTDDTLTSEETEVLKKIFPAVANFAMANTALLIQRGNDGVYTIYSESEFSGNKNSKRPPSDAQLAADKEFHERRAKQYMDKLLTHLNANASDTVFPEYFNSDKYTDPTTAATPDINESLTKTFTF